MDYSDIFAYDETFVVDIVRPDNHEPVGIKIGVRSSESDAVVKALRDLETDTWKARANGDTVEFSQYIADQERAKAKAAIVSWDFNGGSFGKLNDSSVVNEENASYLINHPRAKWIRDQILGASDNISNFTKKLPESAPTL